MFNKKLKLEIQVLKAQLEDLEKHVEEVESKVKSNKKAVFKDSEATKLSKCVDIMRKHGASELILSKYEELLDGLYNRTTRDIIVRYFMDHMRKTYYYYLSFEKFKEYSSLLNLKGRYNFVNAYVMKDVVMVGSLHFDLKSIRYLSEVLNISLSKEQAWLLADLVMYSDAVEKFKNEKEREYFDREHTQLVIDFMRLYVLG